MDAQHFRCTVEVENKPLCKLRGVCGESMKPCLDIMSNQRIRKYKYVVLNATR